MASRRRTLLFLCALGFSAVVAPASAAGARASQDVGATLAGAGQAPTTTVVAGSTTAAETTEETNQTLVEGQDPPAQRLLTESRKVAAVVAGLVLVALALLLLTVRYIRVTKPLPAEPRHEGPDFASLDLDEATAFVERPEASSTPAVPDVADAPVAAGVGGGAGAPASVAAGANAAGRAAGSKRAKARSIDDEALALMATRSETDHDAADDDWEPRTGEHERVEVPSGAKLARPGVAARRKALGLDAR